MADAENPAHLLERLQVTSLESLRKMLLRSHAWTSAIQAAMASHRDETHVENGIDRHAGTMEGSAVDQCHRRIKELEEEVRGLRAQLKDTRNDGLLKFKSAAKLASQTQCAITTDDTMSENVKQWLRETFERKVATGLSLKASVALWAVKYSDGETHRYTVEQMAEKFVVHGEVMEGMRVKHSKTGNEGVVLTSTKVVAVQYSNGEMHRYTADQMAEKFGLRGEVTEGMRVKHRKSGNEGVVLTSFKGKNQPRDTKQMLKGWPEALCDGEKAALLDAKLLHLSSWEFETHSVGALVGGRTLSCVAWRVFAEWDFVSTFPIEPTTLWAWLCRVEREYNDVPYHSGTHAADVLQVVHYLLKTCELAELLTDLQCLAMVFAAIIHDLGHNGQTNVFLRKTADARALKYNDISVQEAGHVARAFEIMHADGNKLNIFGGLQPADQDEIRKIAIDCVLGTDMELHNDQVSEFQAVLDSMTADRDEWISSGMGASELKVIMKFCLHAADLSNPVRPFETARHWADRVFQEFFDQGDEELRLSIPFTNPMNNREGHSLPQTQIGFIKYVIDSTWRKLAVLLPKVNEPCLATLDSNLAEWQRLAALT